MDINELKKVGKIILALIIVALVYQIVVNFFITKHHSNYEIKTGKTKFSVEESYKKKVDMDFIIS